ncbi:MAG: GNAT family N-acetyltransferase [candidate division Zixibacteria bacterium]|nr:GNAT family N-acetyltransferase [candidate division Zixibacteria bacterium]
MLEYRTIEDFDEFLKLESAWDELVANSEVDHAFMKHLWFSELIKANDWQETLSIVTIWSDGQLVAVAPVRRSSHRFGGVRAKGLSFLFSDESPRCNFIVADLDYVELLAERVIGLPDWVLFYAMNLEASLETTKRFMSFLRDGKSVVGIRIEDGLQSPFLLTEGSFEDYWSSFPEKRRKYLERMCIRRLEKSGNYEISQITTSDQFLKFMPTMFEISRKSWKSATDDHIIAESPQGRFYSGFTPVGIDRGLVTLYTIKVDGRLIGFEYLLTCNRKYSLIRCDYDEDFKYYSPGNNLRIAIVRDLFDADHVCEYDLGGDAYPYKLEWCDSIRKHIKVMIGNNTMRGKAIMFAKNKVFPFLRREGLGT